MRTWKKFRIENNICCEAETLSWKSLNSNERKDLLKDVGLPSSFAKESWKELDFRAKERLGKMINKTTKGEFRLDEKILEPMLFDQGMRNGQGAGKFIDAMTKAKITVTRAKRKGVLEVFPKEKKERTIIFKAAEKHNMIQVDESINEELDVKAFIDEKILEPMLFDQGMRNGQGAGISDSVELDERVSTEGFLKDFVNKLTEDELLLCALGVFFTTSIQSKYKYGQKSKEYIIDIGTKDIKAVIDGVEWNSIIAKSSRTLARTIAKKWNVGRVDEESVEHLDEAWTADSVIKNAEIGSKKGYGINIKKTGGVTKTPFKHMLMTMQKHKNVRVTFDHGKDVFEGTPQSVALHINQTLGIKESVELDESRMSELHMLIKQGKSAEQIAKIMKVDVKTIKELMKGFNEMNDAKESYLDEAKKPDYDIVADAILKSKVLKRNATQKDILKAIDDQLTKTGLATTSTQGEWYMRDRDFLSDVISIVKQGLKESVEEYTTRWRDAAKLQEKSDRSADERIPKMSDKGKELLAWMANSFEMTGGPWADKNNVHGLTRYAVDRIIKKLKSLKGLPSDKKKDISLVMKELGEGIEEEISTTTTSVGTLTDPTDMGKKKKKKRCTELDKYIDSQIFTVSSEDFNRCSTGRRKNERWSKFFDSESEQGANIKKYSLRNPKSPIIIKNEENGDMMFLRRRLNDQRLKHNKRK